MCVRMYVRACVCVCVAPEEPDKGRLWEAETEALDNGKAYLIDPERNSEHATWARLKKKKRTHSRHDPLLPKVTSCNNVQLLVIIEEGGRFTPFPTQEIKSATEDWRCCQRI